MIMRKNNVDNLPIINTNISVEDDSYIEMIPEHAQQFLALVDNTILLTSKEIMAYNERIKERSSAFYDLEEMLNLKSNEIEDLIQTYSLPSFPKYAGSYVYTSQNTQDILANRNLSNITSNIRRGLIIKRTNLRSFPTDKHFYNHKNVWDFDRLQETEVAVNTPVLVCHESQDGNWSFVITPTYVGWVAKTDIALAQKEDWDYFIDNDNFVIITADSVNALNLTLNMGVKLPYKGLQDNAYLVDIPTKDEKGNVVKTSVTIKRNEAHVGYLPYTKKNLIIQAFKYENTPYSWGGLNEGLDCSSYIASLFKTFGFEFPRNTSAQRNSVGEIISVEGKSSAEKLAIIDDEYLSILYRLGHVMLYLGKVNDINYIIHANAKDMRVSVTPLTFDNENLKAIDRVVLVKK